MRARFLSFLFLAGLLAGCSGDSEGPTDPSPNPSPTNAVSYTVLGASDGIGVGGSIVCAPFDLGCENGTGYAQTLRRRLQADGRTVTYNNLSVPGYVLSNAIVELAQRSGRSDTPGTFIDRYTPFIPPTTTVITLFVGGNDANIIGSAVNAGLGGTGSGVRDFVDAQVRQWGNDLGDLIARIRTRAPNARIVAYNLPNLALAPYIASRPVSEKGVMQRIATGLADQVNALTSRGVLVVDMMCDARVVQASSFASDGFHPSDAGYALMADIAYSAVANGSAATPQSSCPVRTAVPVF